VNGEWSVVSKEGIIQKVLLTTDHSPLAVAKIIFT
jgi:hypothetical protein